MLCVYRSAYSEVLIDINTLSLVCPTLYTSIQHNTFTKDRREQETLRVQSSRFFRLNFITILPDQPRVQIG